MKDYKIIKSQYSDDTPGYACAVITGSNIVWSDFRGSANLKSGTLINQKTAFRLASISKPFTALAVLMLYENKKIDLDMPIREYLSDLPAYADKITIRQLLTHTSGLPDHEAPLYKSIKKTDEPTLRDALRVLQLEKTTVFSPGNHYEYSNSGYVILALLVEYVTGTRFATFVEENITNPTGMINTLVVDERKPFIPNRAMGYQKRNGNYELFDYDQLNYIVGDEGIYSSVSDLAQWMRVWSTEILLSKETIQNTLTQGLLNTGNNSPCGLGWFLKNIKGRNIMYHEGYWVGFNNMLIRDSDSDVTVIFLSNSTDFAGEKIKLKLTLDLLEKYEKGLL